MTLFKMGKLSACCESESTRMGFCHVAVLFINGSEVARAKCCYLNRTWESFQYQSVLSELMVRAKAIPQITAGQIARFKKKYDVG